MSKKKVKVAASMRPATPETAQFEFAGARAAPANGNGRQRTAFAADTSLPTEMGKGDWTAIFLSLMMFFSPAIGVPTEYMLQDTLKSIVVSCITFFAMAVFFFRIRNRSNGLRFHWMVGLFALLAVYALFSMIWAHTFLAGVEAARWIVLTVVVFLALNSFSRERLPLLAAGVHFGAVVATIWAAAQYWFDWRGIPQGPPPASTFVNRNFYAEFMACTIPFGAYLLFTARRTPWVFLLAFTNAFALVGIMMTGTRSAMIGTALALIFIAVAAVLYRKQFSFSGWSSGKRIMAITTFGITMGILGSIGTGTKGFERPNITPWERAFFRASLIATPTEYTTGSASVRKVMWLATINMIQKRPLSGVGAGTWEADIPLYQAEGSHLETDYYVHNEILQLLAEYGLVGWMFLLGLFGYLLRAAWRTLRAKTAEEKAEAPVRALVLTALLAFLTVSNAGFPWRMASTGAMFALAVGALAASDARLGYRSWFAAMRLNWSPVASQISAAAAMVGLSLSMFISYQAYECERLIVQGTKLALAITAGGDVNSPKWDKTKKEMYDSLRRGVAINPHYRKITPMAGDEAARWGDWKNAIWIWESVLSSRPYVVALMGNAARGHLHTGNPAKALEWVAKGLAVQPKLGYMRGIEVTALQNLGRVDETIEKMRQALKDSVLDAETVTNMSIIAISVKEYALAEQFLKKRLEVIPQAKADTYHRLANLNIAALGQEKVGLSYFKLALETLATPQERVNLLSAIPTQFHSRLGVDFDALGVPAGVLAQMQSSAAAAAAARAAAVNPSPTQAVLVKKVMDSNGFAPQPVAPVKQ